MTVIPISTRIYVKRLWSPYLCIQPGTVLNADTFVVLYDVFVNKSVVIPAGSLATGNWTTSTITPSALLTLTNITINNTARLLTATSNLFTTTTAFEASQIENSLSLSLLKNYKSVANIFRRLVKIKCQSVILYNEVPDTVFIEVPCNEIVTTLTANLFI